MLYVGERSEQSSTGLMGNRNTIVEVSFEWKLSRCSSWFGFEDVGKKEKRMGAKDF